MPVQQKKRQTPLKKLASKAKSSDTWADVDVPTATMQVLHKIAAVVGQAEPLSKSQRSAASGGLGRGVVVLFAGPSSANKAKAAEALAHELGRPLQRVDLSKVVSKYIGETEKNLQRIFDAALASNAMLFFDEADALFGKRSEVKGGRNRHANIEINFLLQRLEAFQGLAVITTNGVKPIDPALKKLCGSVVSFPRKG